MPAIPLSFREIADDLDDRIQRGEYDNDEKRLPTYVQVADIYDVSRSTAARAYALLVDRGRVKGSAGRGMYVND
jgi:GntR family transcriptional regulator